GLFDVGVRNPDRLLATNKGRVAWQRRLSEIFTQPQASSDGGWNFDRLSRSNLFVGSVGTSPRTGGGKESFDLARTMTAGFAISNGHVVWRKVGLYACNLLPCPGGNEAGYTAPTTVSAFGPSI